MHCDWFVLPLLLPTPIPSPLWLRLRHPFLMFTRSYSILRLRLRLQSRLRCQWIHFFRPVHTRGMLLKRGTGSGERGTSIGNGKMKNWKQNLTWNLVLSATSFCSQFSSSRSPFPVPRFSNIHASQSLNRKNTTDFVFRSKRELNVYYLVFKRV